jgi:lipid-binding SYLF domain-containing protein
VFSNFKFLGLIATILLSAVTVFPQTEDNKEIREATSRAADAAKAFNDVMSKADKSIPRELLERAEAVAVFPGVLKAAFVIGGRGGEGLISRRTPEGWSAPAFFKLGGGSFGFQIGADKTDYIMLFLNDGGLKGLLQDKFEFGGDVGIAAGPVGREASATTTARLNAGILSYSRSKGAFIGAALKGTRIAPDNDTNRTLYGKTAKEILNSNQVTPFPDQVKVFPNTLSRYSSRKGSTIEGAPANSNSTRQRTTMTVNNGNTIIVGSAPKTTDEENGSLNNSSTASTTTPDTVSSTEKAVTTGSVGNLPNPRGETYGIGRMSTRPSNRLAREIRSELLDLPYYGIFDWLEFEVSSSNSVTLRGSVTRPTTRDDAESRVKNVEGVSAVRNEIEVLPVSQSDDDLRNALYRQVYSGQLFRYGTGANQPIHIIVKNGHVNLKGVVDNEADKNYAGIQANGVTGVFDVKNDLNIDGGEKR